MRITHFATSCRRVLRCSSSILAFLYVDTISLRRASLSLSFVNSFLTWLVRLKMGSAQLRMNIAESHLKDVPDLYNKHQGRFKGKEEV